MMFSSTVASLPYVHNRQLRGLAVTSLKRVAAAPSVPTIAESGFPGFESSSWVGVLVPARTPPPVIDKLNREIIAALRAANVAETLAGMGAEPGGSSPKEFGAYFQAETRKWGAVIRNSGMHLN